MNSSEEFGEMELSNGKKVKNLPEEIREMLANMGETQGPSYAAIVEFVFNLQNVYMMWDGCLAKDFSEETRMQLHTMANTIGDRAIAMGLTIKLLGDTEHSKEEIATITQNASNLHESIKKDIDALFAKQMEYN